MYQEQHTITNSKEKENMARIDLTKANGWIPEPTGSEVIKAVEAQSAIQQVARKVRMTSNSQRVLRFGSTDVDIVAEGTQIPQASANLDTVLLETTKFADRFTISEEDNEDAVVDFLAQAKNAWASNFAKRLDHAALGVTSDAVAPGTDVPFLSVYAAATDAGNVVSTTGALEFEMLNDAFSAMETGEYGDDAVIIAHPSFKGALRNLKDADGLRVVSEPGNAGLNPTIFGVPVVYTTGARTDTTAKVAPTGNPLLIVGNRQHLILGNRTGIESQVAAHRWDYDERELKVRARVAFVPATGEAFQVIEKTEV